MAVFSNELKLDTTSFQSSLKKAATDSKASADEISKALTIKPDIDTKAAASSVDGFASQAKSKFAQLGSDLKSGLSGSLSGIGGAISGGIIGGGVVAGVQAAAGTIVDGFKFVIDKGSEFQTSLKGLSALTGVTGDQLEMFGDKAKELAAKFGGDATNQLGAFQGILSKFGPDLAKTPDALNAVSENVNVLAKAAGLDATQSFDALGNSLLQFGIDASDPARLAAESGRFINVLAAGAKEGAAEIPQVADAILQAGVAAKGANLSFEETNAAIQVLAAGGKVGSEAGVGLRNVLGLLIKQSGPGAEALKGVGLSVEGLGKTLTEQGLQAALLELQSGIDKLGSDAEKAAFKATLFGSENAATAGILLDGAAAMGTLTEKITGTSSATEQAQINMATFSEFMSRLQANLGNIAISIFDGFAKAFGIIGELTAGPVGSAIDSMVAQFENMWSIIKPILIAIGGFIIANIVTAINYTATVLDVMFDIANQVFDGIMTALSPLVDAFKSVFGIDGAVGEGLDIMQIFKDALNTVSEVLGMVGGVIKQVGGFIVSLLVTPFEFVVKIITSVIHTVGKMIDAFKDFIGISRDNNKQTDKGIGVMDRLRQTFANIKGTIGGVTEAFKVVKIVIGEFFDALLNLDIGKALNAFTGLGEKVAQGYNKGFNEAIKTEVPAPEQKKKGGPNADQELDALSKRLKLQDEADDKDKDKDKDDKKKAKEQKSQFEKINDLINDRVKARELELKILENQDKLEGKLTKKEIDLKFAKLRAEDTEKIAKEANELLQTKFDEKGNLVGLGIKLNEDETISDVNEFVQGLKLKALEAQVKLVPDKKADLEGIKLIEQRIKALQEKSARDITTAEVKLRREAEEAGFDAAGQKKFVEERVKSLKTLAEVEILNLIEDIAGVVVDKTTGLAIEISPTFELAEGETAADVLDKYNKIIASLNKDGKAVEIKTEVKKDNIIGNFIDNAVGAIQKIDWNKVFARPAKASEEATKKIVDSITEGTMSYQDGIDELSEGLGKVPGIFDAIRMQLNETFTALTEESTAALAKAASGAKSFGEVYDELAVVAGAAFGKVITEQKDFGTAILLIALDTLEALIPILVAQITGLSLASPASVATAGAAGLILAAALTATLYGIVAAAKASIQGFAEGGYTGDGGKYQPAGIVHKGEFVINKENTSKFRGILEQMNKGNLPLTMNAQLVNPQISTEMSGMRQELAAIRQRLDRMPDGIQGRMNVGVDVGLDTYLFKRDQYRAAVRGLRG